MQRQKTCLRGFINQSVQSQKRARILKFWLLVEKELFYPCSENKSADSYCEADLRLLFWHRQKSGFLTMQLSSLSSLLFSNASNHHRTYEPRHEKTIFCILENKDADQLCSYCTSAFVLTSRVVHVNLKCHASCLLL